MGSCKHPHVFAHSISALKVFMAKGQKMAVGSSAFKSAAVASLDDDCMTMSCKKSSAGFALVCKTTQHTPRR